MSTVANRILYVLHANFSCSAAQIKQIQAQLIIQRLHSDTAIAHHFTNACHSVGLLDSAYCLFIKLLSRPHVFICNSLIRAFCHSHVPFTSLAVYSHMHKNSIAPNNYTFPFLLKSLSDFGDIRQAQCVHTQVKKFGHIEDIYIQNSLLDVYASCGQMKLCRRLFDEMSHRDVVSWTVVVMGYRNAGKCDDALIVFEQMQYAGVEPNRVTMVNALCACAGFGALEMGIWIHGFIKRKGWELDVILGTSLVEMYLKCGRIGEGLAVFQSIKEKNVSTWNAIIKGLALARNGKEAVWFFNKMEQEGYKADEVTLLAVISACTHAGLVDTGRRIFGFLIDGIYGFSPNVKHYACMVDLLTRAGLLQEAFELMECMPFKPTSLMWGSLLFGSKAIGNLEWSEFSARMLVGLEPDNSAHYVVLSNLYAEMGRWAEVEQVRSVMRDRGLVKDLGCSSLELEFSRSKLATYQQEYLH